MGLARQSSRLPQQTPTEEGLLALQPVSQLRTSQGTAPHHRKGPHTPRPHCADMAEWVQDLALQHLAHKCGSTGH